MRALASVVLLALVACDLADGPVDGMVPLDGAPDDGAVLHDGAVPPDGAVDAGPADGTVPDGALLDGAIGPDASPDAGCACPPPANECLVASCPDGTCGEEPLPDLTPCGGVEMDGWCLGGTCTPRGCGDGIRERGPMPMRESCDDGNTDDADACSNACEPQAFTIREGTVDRDLEVAGGRRSGALDAGGTMLFAWREHELDSGLTRVAGRRYTAAGVALGAAFPIHETFLDASVPEVSASSRVTEGFTVTWAEGGEVYLAVVDGAGAVSLPERANATTDFDQFAPTVAAVDGGTVIAWVEAEGSLVSPRETIWLRRFDPAGGALGPAVSVPGPSTERHLDPFVVGHGATAFVAWRNGPASGTGGVILGRTFDSSGPVEAMPVRLSGAAALAAAPRATAHSTGDFVVAYSDAEDTYLRDLMSAAPMPLAASMDTVEVEPSLAAYGAEFAAAHVEGRGSARTMVLTGVGGPLAPEEALLAAELTFAETITLVAHPDGLVAIFSDIAAWPRLRAFLLPENP